MANKNNEMCCMCGSRKDEVEKLISVCRLSRKHLILLTFTPFSGIMIARILTKTTRFSCSFLQILSI